VVIQNIDIVGVAAVKPDDDTPIGLHSDAPITFPVSLERVEPKGRRSHVLDRLRLIQMGENRSHLVEKIGPDAPDVTMLVEAFQPAVTEATNR
jgi:hypothetical protein